MLRNIKEKIKNVLCDLIYRLGQLIMFFIDIVLHPIKNISCIFIVVLYVLLEKTNIHKLSGKDMFLFSAGMVTVLTFIVSFLQSVTVESNNKEKFYFGYNLKRNLYNNFWIKRLYEMNIKLFLWLIFIIPCLRIATNYHYEYTILNNFIDFIKKKENNLYCIWVSIIVVVCIYFAAILIESIDITKNKFRLSNFYAARNEMTKNIIELEVEKEYRNYFKNALNNSVERFYNFYNQINVYNLMRYIFRRANEVTDTQDEFNEYLNHVFNAENDCVDEIFIKIDDLIKSICKIKNPYIKKIKVRSLKKYFKKLKSYYVKKWNSIKQSSYYKYSFLAICKIINNDLIGVTDLEDKFINKIEDEDIKKIYKDLFEDDCSNEMIFRDSKMVGNICISRIIAVLIEMCKKKEMYEELNFNNDIYIIFNTLNLRHDLKNYISKVFEYIFDYILKCENRNNNFTKEFCNILKSNYCDQYKYIINEAKKCSYKEIMSGNNISDFQLSWLLSLLNNNDVVVALIFGLAYAERSGKDYMSVSAYKIWGEKINKLIYKNILGELNDDRYIDEIIKKIEESYVSHFIYPKFIKWLCKSLFVNFDSVMYHEFKELGDKGIRNNFGLCSYMILRSLLRGKANIYNSLLFTEDENKEIQKELLPIKEIILLP